MNITTMFITIVLMASMITSIEGGFVACCICYAGLTATCGAGCVAIAPGTMGAGGWPCIVAACGSGATVCQAVCVSPTP